MAEAGNAPVLGIIRNMGRPEERQEMVLAHGLEADVADGYQAVCLRYNRSGPFVVRIFLQAGKKLAEGSATRYGVFSMPKAVKSSPKASKNCFIACTASGLTG